MKKAHAALTGNRCKRWVAMAVGCAALAGTAGSAGADGVTPLLVCSKGPSGQRFHAVVTLPNQVDAGSIYTVRIDGVSSGKVTHFGLNYIHDMTVDYVFPAGAYVEGSARFVPGTGTANVLVGPSLSYGGGVLSMVLPGRVENGANYTPPSVEFKLRANGAPGSRAAVSLSHYRLTANAIVVGEVPVSCEPTPKPYPIGTTVVGMPATASLP